MQEGLRKMADKEQGGLPASTTTEEWRAMSAKVAWALWSNPLRSKLPSAFNEPATSWDALAAKFRERVRYVLRQLFKDKIVVDDLEGHQSNGAAASDSWDKATARFAWLLWLRKRREENAADEFLEKVLWESDAPEFRRYVRTVMKDLQDKESISIRSEG